jgi:hypothetical protein
VNAARSVAVRPVLWEIAVVMKHPHRNHSTSRRQSQPQSESGDAPTPPSGPPIPVDAGRQYRNPLHYDHPYPSMAEFAKLLALRYDANRTRHSYYRDMRLVHQRFECDPSALSEEQLRDYFLHVKFGKHWKPKTIRQTVASSKIFYVDIN